jgi:hypothetical protein
MLRDNLRRAFEDRILGAIAYGYKNSVILFSGELFWRMASKKRYPNAILQALPSADFNFIAMDLKPVELVKGDVVFEQDRVPGKTYFPLTSVISFSGDTGEGGSVEVWAVGSEGAAGIFGIIGRTEAFRGVVQVPGTALVSKSSALRKHLQRGAAFHNATLKYLDYLLIQICYLGICNNSHSIEQRFSRWLLMMQDRARSIELRFTQDAIAGVLGTRRATISVAAAALQNAGLIRYTPGSITIRSRKALERAACGCYKAISSSCR